MSEYLRTKNYIIPKKDIISLDEYGDKIRIKYRNWLKDDSSQIDCPEGKTQYESTIFVEKKDIKKIRGVDNNGF